MDAYMGDGLNRYLYVRNNPLIYIDPLGLAKNTPDIGSDLVSCGESNSPDAYWYRVEKIINYINDNASSRLQRKHNEDILHWLKFFEGRSNKGLGKDNNTENKTVEV